jgi:hypothetical protein
MSGIECSFLACRFWRKVVQLPKHANAEPTRKKWIRKARPLIAGNPPARPGRREKNICTSLAKGDLGVSQADGVPYSRVRRNQILFNQFHLTGPR